MIVETFDSIKISLSESNVKSFDAKATWKISIDKFLLHFLRCLCSLLLESKILLQIRQMKFLNDDVVIFRSTCKAFVWIVINAFIEYSFDV